MYYALPLGVNIVCYVLCITYYAYYALRTGSPHRLLCITYYVLRIMHYALGVHIVYYVLRTTYYVLCITHWESTSYVMYYVLCIVYDASYIAHFRQAHHVCVLAATFYVLAAGTCTYYENIQRLHSFISGQGRQSGGRANRGPCWCVCARCPLCIRIVICILTDP